MTFRHFIESVSPLVSRNQYIFLKAARKAIKFTRTEREIIVSLKDNTQMSDGSANKQNSNKIITSQSKRSRVGSYGDIGSNITMGNSGDNNINSGSSGSSSSSSNVDIVGPQDMKVVQYVAPQLLSQVVLHWARACAIKNGVLIDDPCLAVGNELLDIHIPITKLLMIIADLISSIPGLATCIHRFNITK